MANQDSSPLGETCVGGAYFNVMSNIVLGFFNLLCVYIFFFGGGFNYRSMKRMSSVWISRKWVIKEKLRGLWWLKCSGPSKSEQIKEEISSRIKHKIIIEEFLSMLCVPLRTHHLIWLQVTRRGSSNVSKKKFSHSGPVLIF